MRSGWWDQRIYFCLGGSKFRSGFGDGIYPCGAIERPPRSFGDILLQGDVWAQDKDSAVFSSRSQCKVYGMQMYRIYKGKVNELTFELNPADFIAGSTLVFTWVGHAETQIARL